MNPKHKAFACLETLRQCASARLSVYQREFLYYKMRCDLEGMEVAKEETRKAWNDCGRFSNAIRKLGIKARVT